MRYFTINKFSKIVWVTPQTLRNWDKSGKLKPHHTTENGYRYYSEKQLKQILWLQPKPRTVIGYCRVSSPKQKDDLERQIENVKTYLLAQGKPFEIISDVGSGINCKRKGLLELLGRINQDEVEKVVILYKDRLTRFGFELIEYFALLHGGEIETIDNTQKIDQEELERVGKVTVTFRQGC